MIARFALPLALTSLGIGLAGLSWPQDQNWVVLIGGDTDGYLSPCGCTKPMTGGIRRRATAVQRFRRANRTLVLENGGLVKGRGRQDELKAETMAQALKQMGVDALHLTASEAALGRGMVLSLSRLIDGPVLSTSVAPGSGLPLVETVSKGPFLIAGISPGVAGPLGLRPIEDSAAVRTLVNEAQASEQVPVLLFGGGEAGAERLAQEFPSLRLIVYRTNGGPPSQPKVVGSTWIVSPGERGKSMLRLSLVRGRFASYAPVTLGPEFADDPSVTRFYARYLQRVGEAGLLKALPREPSEAFAGSKACMPCHTNSHRIWRATEHGHALSTLEKDGHDRDPDCVGCHVVGLDKQTGFRTRRETPNLADVGCESCHGPARDHARNPRGVPMGKVGEKSCAPCHVPDHSPNFDYQTYWKRIAH